MTGSGKTGLLVGLIEEAAIDGIPTLVIDPKGDLANVLLSFPNLAPADFQPWVDPDAAKRDGITLEELAARTAKTWSNGLAASGQSGERIQRLHEAVEMAVYTPGSRSGIPLAMLGSLEAPPPAILDDAEARRELSRVDLAVPVAIQRHQQRVRLLVRERVARQRQRQQPANRGYRSEQHRQEADLARTFDRRHQLHALLAQLGGEIDQQDRVFDFDANQGDEADDRKVG